VLDIVREVAGRRGATVVLSTHTLPDVEEVCSTVLILMRGRMLDAGSVSAVSALAAAPRSAQLRVPVELMGAARHAITDGPGLRVDGVEGRPDLLRVSATTGEVASANELNAALRAVLAAGVPVLGYEVDGGRLNDAFLAMTKEGSR